MSHSDFVLFSVHLSPAKAGTQGAAGSLPTSWTPAFRGVDDNSGSNGPPQARERTLMVDTITLPRSPSRSAHSMRQAAARDSGARLLAVGLLYLMRHAR